MDPSKADDTHHIDFRSDESFPDEEDSLVSSLKEKLETFSSTICIYKVPEEISVDDRDVFIPVKVSIGPFYHGSSHLQAMEEHKWRYSSAFLKRQSFYNENSCWNVIEKQENKIRECYAVELKVNSKEFIEMMLLDCCFILELLLRYSNPSPRRRNDPIFTTPGLLLQLRCDLILLENQIPFFLLNEIFNNAQIVQQENDSLNDLAFRFFRNIISGERQCIFDKFMQESADHLLDMVHYCFLSTYPRLDPKGNQKSKLPLSPAFQVQKNGIKFKDAEKPKSLLDIKFQNGVLEIPPLKVHPYTERILKNFMAYEHCQSGSAQQVKSYVNLMGHLLQSDKDVKLLRGRKILTDTFNNELDEKEIIENLKWMRQDKLSSSAAHYFDGVIQKVNEYPKTCVGLCRNLKTNPIAIVIAGFFILLLIFAAAFFSAFAFLQHH